MNRSKMRGGDLTINQRIDEALKRITDGHGLMRVPVEATDPDIVLADCAKALDYYRAGSERRRPKWVPSRILLLADLAGDPPIGHNTTASAGEHECRSNGLGAIYITASNGQNLGVKPAEFEPLEWRKNEDV